MKFNTEAFTDGDDRNIRATFPENPEIPEFTARLKDYRTGSALQDAILEWAAVPRAEMPELGA